MSDTVKLIVDIPEDALKEMKTEEFISIESLDTAIECIQNGTPLDDVKAEINAIEEEYCDLCAGYCGVSKAEVLDILDNIGKENSDEEKA